MKNLFRRLLKYVAYSAAGVVIFLAIIVGLFRLFLPRLPEYQEEIKDWASAAIGMDVEFSGMDARWGLSGPELEFYNAELLRQDTMVRLIAAEEVSVGVGLMRLLIEGNLLVDRIVVRDTSIEVRQLESGRWLIQGSLVDDLVSMQNASGRDIGGIEVIGEDIELHFLQPGDERPKTFQIPRLHVRRDSARLAVDGTVLLPAGLGDRLTVAATQLLAPPAEERSWDVTIEADDLSLLGLSGLHQSQAAQFVSGNGDIDLSLAYANGEIKSATADVDFVNILHQGGLEFDVSGRLEFRDDPDGWLLAADRFQIITPAGQWPRQRLRVETSTDSSGKVIMLDAHADYINLADAGLLEPWLNEQQNRLLSQLNPSGAVSDLDATLSDVDTDAPRYNVEADLDRVGISAYEKIPGVRGFSGSLRADRAGGRLEIDSQDVSVSLANYLDETITLDAALGTVIWRRSNNRTTLLSDSIEIRNADFESESNVELTFVDGGGAPVIDLASTWSITDVSSARRYLPEKVMKPRPYQWLQQALIAGRIPRGTTRLYGPLDKFPFDAGEGRLLIEANVRDATLLYNRNWPAAEFTDLDVALENMRLYSTRSRSSNLGNQVVDPKVEILDFRDPVLTIDAFATGTLETIRQFSMQSPIGEILGGQLDRVTVSGDASFDLTLTMPIRDLQNFEFTSRIRANGGSLQVEGLDPPLTDLRGVVTIDRETISSEALTGQFLGRAVEIDLAPAPESIPTYRVVARASGIATAVGLVEGFGIPLEDFIGGQASYTTSLYFPRGQQEIPPPFRIEIESDLAGFAVDLPVPLMKDAADAMPVSGTIEFPRDSETIHTAGTAGDLIAWQAAFVKTEDHWDFDRGDVSIGGEPAAIAETRGLHLRGSTKYLRLQDWLDLTKRENTQGKVAERIRSIDMTVENLHLLGQHIVGHHVRVDRSAQDWLVQFDGDNISGSAVVPYEFTSDRVLALDMDKMILPGDDEDKTVLGASVDPRSLPTISIKAAELALGDRFLGAVEATFQRTEDGFEVANVLARDETFEITGTGRWTVDPTDPVGHRSSFSGTLTSTNIERTMERLNYTPGIDGNDLKSQFDMSWSGGPRKDFMDSLDGDVQVQFGAGQLVEVEPGAGRMFGLMSVGALPRRLSLDFSDVFNKGFGFDSINGNFRLVDGEAYTCNLSLNGPAADIGIVGRASLVARDYEQTAVVSANVGNTLPVVGAVIAGPQVAAAMLIFSQIFKKPLQDMGQVYYSIAGSWDEPIVDLANAERFAADGVLAGCLENSE